MSHYGVTSVINREYGNGGVFVNLVVAVPEPTNKKTITVVEMRKVSITGNASSLQKTNNIRGMSLFFKL